MPYRRSLTVVHVAEPCEERWDRMEGDHRARFCRTCEKHVYDLSQMTLPEASALIELTNGTACVRFFRRADGTIAMNEDCRSDRARARRKRWIRGAALTAAIGASVVGVLVGAMVASRRPSPPRTEHAAPADRGQWVMGAMAGTLRPRGPTWIDPESLHDEADGEQLDTEWLR